MWEKNTCTLNNLCQTFHITCYYRFSCRHSFNSSKSKSLNMA